MLEIDLTNQFKKDLKKIAKQNKNRKKLDEVIELLQKEEPLAIKHRDHDLIGNWKGYRECHVTPDWLLIYKVIEGHVRLLRLARTGSHSELFK